MCRSTSDGGRRCTGSSRARTRALGTARKAVERARHAADQARAAGDPDAVDAAEAALTAARQHLDATRAAHPHTPTAGQPQGHDNDREAAMPEDTNTHGARDESAAPAGDTTSDTGGEAPRTQTTSHIGPDGSTFSHVNYAAPGATVGFQAHTVTGATVVMGGGPVPADLPDQLRNLHERVQSAMGGGRYTVHHSDDVTEPTAGTTTTNVARGNERVAFQVGYVHRSGDTNA